MSSQTQHKQERVVEAIRQGLEGMAAVEFIQKSGFAMTPAGIARNLRRMGGRAHVQELLAEGLTNTEVLERCLPKEDFTPLHLDPPSQQDLFGEPPVATSFSAVAHDTSLYDTTRVTLVVPSDLYEALRLACRAEGKSLNRLVVEILTTAMSRMPLELPEEDSSESA